MVLLPIYQRKCSEAILIVIKYYTYEMTSLNGFAAHLVRKHYYCAV